MAITNKANKNPDTTEETGRNPDGTWKKGFSGNLDGRPRSPLKAFQLSEFIKMTDDEKRKFLELVSPEMRWRMAEGNPPQKIQGDLENPLFPDKIEITFKKKK